MELLTLEPTPGFKLNSTVASAWVEYSRSGRPPEEQASAIDAIRFYQKSGLLKPPARTAAGYRVFTEAEIAELQFIARAQDLGFSLAEIKELVSLRNEDDRSCPEVRSLMRRKLQNVREKIAGLTELENELSRAMRACDRALRAHAAMPHGCAVIERIAAGKTRRKT